MSSWLAQKQSRSLTCAWEPSQAVGLWVRLGCMRAVQVAKAILHPRLALERCAAFSASDARVLLLDQCCLCVWLDPVANATLAMPDCA
eukprot:1158317-Pelagomonas_calceolata.AAC.5